MNNPALLNLVGNNSIAGSISLTTGGFGAGNTRIKVNAATLSLNGAISPSASSSGPVTFIFDAASGLPANTDPPSSVLPSSHQAQHCHAP